MDRYSVIKSGWFLLFRHKDFGGDIPLSAAMLNRWIAANVSELAYHACCTKSSGGTHIFMVPFGPRLLLSTSCSPRAALMLTARAAWALATSALGFRAFTAAIAQHNQRSTSKVKSIAGRESTLLGFGSSRKGSRFPEGSNTCSRAAFRGHADAGTFRIYSYYNWSTPWFISVQKSHYIFRTHGNIVSGWLGFSKRNVRTPSRKQSQIICFPTGNIGKQITVKLWTMSWKVITFCVKHI